MPKRLWFPAKFLIAKCKNSQLFSVTLYKVQLKIKSLGMAFGEELIFKQPETRQPREKFLLDYKPYATHTLIYT